MTTDITLTRATAERGGAVDAAALATARALRDRTPLRCDGCGRKAALGRVESRKVGTDTARISFCESCAAADARHRAPARRTAGRTPACAVSPARHGRREDVFRPEPRLKVGGRVTSRR